MDKPKGAVVTVIVVVVLIVVGLLLYLRGFGVPTDNVTVTSVVGGNGEDEPGQVKTVVLDGPSSYMSLKVGETETQRGIKSYEFEDFQEQLDKLRVRFGVPSKSDCDSDLPEPDSYLSITEGNSTKGIVYFCSGVGVDEATNIVGPYQDLLKLIEDTEV